MWIELGITRPNVNLAGGPVQRIWVNTDHFVRVEFVQENGKFTATVISTKPGGSDRSIFSGDDAERIRLALECERHWKPLLEFEKPQPEEPKKKNVKRKTR